jgi:poly(A) polymerase
MPIITPAYPSMCATHNITKSTKEIIQRELKRGGNITDQIMMGKLAWKSLFEKHTFFTQGYKYYLSVISASTTKDAQLVWSGLVESKVRLLVVGLEGHSSIALAHPFNKGFERVHTCHNDEEIEKAKSGSLEFQIKDIPTEATDAAHDLGVGAIVKDETTNGDKKIEEGENITTVYTTTHYIGLELKEGKYPFLRCKFDHTGHQICNDCCHSFALGILLIRAGAKSLDLSWQVEEFKRICTSWDKYNQELNALNVMHTRK